MGNDSKRLADIEARLEVLDGKNAHGVYIHPSRDCTAGKCDDAIDRLSSLEATVSDLRLSALEAKAGEGKGCGQCPPNIVIPDGATAIVTHCTRGYESDTKINVTPAPQPGDRIKLRDVPVGRWWVGCFSVLSEWYEHPCKVRRFDGNKSSHPYLVDCSNGSSSWLEGDTIVTLLPEDYEPGRKAESKQEWIAVVSTESDQFGVGYTTEQEWKCGSRRIKLYNAPRTFGGTRMQDDDFWKHAATADYAKVIS